MPALAGCDEMIPLQENNQNTMEEGRIGENAETENGGNEMLQVVSVTPEADCTQSQQNNTFSTLVRSTDGKLHR